MEIALLKFWRREGVIVGAGGNNRRDLKRGGKDGGY